MKKILCPIDFSDTAQNAIAYASKLAKATGSSVTLLNIQPAVSTTYANLSSEEELSLHAIAERMEELSKEVRQFFKISCDSEVLQSPSLLSIAIGEKGENYDLIVMGTNGVENLFEFFSGTQTYQTIRKSKAPILLVPPSCVYSEIKSIVYAFNYLHERKLPLAQLLPWIKVLKCETTVLQVNEEAISQDVDDEMKELQLILSQEWTNKDVTLNFDSIRTAEIAQSINSYIQRNEKDVLALCTSHRNFIEELFHKSVIKIISGIASYPVFVFHE